MAEIHSAEACADAKPKSVRKLRSSPLYRAWEAMKCRCFTKSSGNYHKYGGRGITVLEPWKSSFKEFENDMLPTWKPGLTLDRIDSNGPYCAANCRWADVITQANNRGCNLILEHDGLKMTAAQWARKLNVRHKTLLQRIYSGWSVADVLGKPFDGVRFAKK